MTGIPTESRIFADRYCREIKRLEALHAGEISPGAKTWRDAMTTLFTRIQQTRSPTKRAAMLRKAIDYLDSIRRENYTHIKIDSRSASRSGSLALATFTVDLHPLIGVDETGIKIMFHYGRFDRNGVSNMISDLDLAYISKHAIGRVHEREHHLTSNGMTGGLACIGVLGYLTKSSAKHVAGQLCLRIGDTLVVGSLKHSRKFSGDGGEINGTFYDVRTALPADEVNNRDMLEQGLMASHIVHSWFGDPTSDDRALADQIPFLPRRSDDYTLRSAVRH